MQSVAEVVGIEREEIDCVAGACCTRYWHVTDVIVIMI